MPATDSHPPPTPPTVLDHLFIQEAVQDPFYYLAVVLSLVISITLHELAHGWAAIRLGDDTPIRQGRMTGNPIVHLGPYSMIALAVFGLAWGQMPIDPSRLRGRHGDALVSAAGPAMNLALAVVCLGVFVVLMRAWDPTSLHGYVQPPLTAVLAGAPAEELSPLQHNALRLVAVAGVFNLLLLVFNLFPVYPLDGSHILGSYLPQYRKFLDDPAHQGTIWLGFILAFAAAGVVLPYIVRAAAAAAQWGVGGG